MDRAHLDPGGWGPFVPIINGPVKLLLFTGNSFAFNMIKLLVNETKFSSLLARTRALILYILV